MQYRSGVRTAAECCETHEHTRRNGVASVGLNCYRSVQQAKWLQSEHLLKVEPVPR